MANYSGFEKLSLEDMRTVNNICDDFELLWRDWEAGNEPSFHQFVDRLPATGNDLQVLKKTLSLALIEIDRQARARRGLPRSQSHYEQMLSREWHDVLESLDWTNEVRATSDRIGQYRIIRSLGTGGMGSVYLAEQSEPISRQVALKVIKSDSPTREILSRFDAERQALALMDHVNIAKIFDAGATEAGLPFFVMEFVEGIPITQYADLHRLSTRERLELTIQVCRAIQHAHIRGIIHRDIKPSNVLVAVQDGLPVVKVIDFGLAKAVQERTLLTDRTHVTQPGFAIGTLAYMSPEQADLQSRDIDTRTDVYSLGVLLYELLTGTTPIVKERLEKEAFDRLLAIIREEDAVLPSRRLSGLGDLIDSVCQQRRIAPKQLQHVLKGELDWIAAKALEKDRDRRYESPAALAADLQRYLQDEVVDARPPSATYRLGKVFRKNRAVTLSLFAVVVALIAGVIGTTLGMLEARKQQSIARDESIKSDRARLAAEQALLKEERQRRYAEAIASFVKDDFLAVTSVDGQLRFGGESLNRNSTLVDLLQRAGEKLDLRKDLDPLLEAELRWVVGVNFRGSGKAAAGLPFLEKAYQIRQAILGESHPDTLSVANSLAVSQLDVGQIQDAVDLFERIERLAKNNPEIEPTDYWLYVRGLSTAYLSAGRTPWSVEELKKVLAMQELQLGNEHPDTAVSMLLMAQCQRELGNATDALKLLVDALRLLEQGYGPAHPMTLTCITALAGAYSESGELIKALELFQKSFDLRCEVLGEEHPDTLSSMSRLAAALRLTGKVTEAVRLLEKTYALHKKVLGKDDLQSVNCANSLAVAYNEIGQSELAIPLLTHAIKIETEKLGEDHLDTLVSNGNLALAYKGVGQLQKAIELNTQTLNLFSSKHGSNHPHTMNTMMNLAMCYREVGELDQAIPMLESTLRLRQARLGEHHVDTLTTMANLAATYWSAEQLDKSIPMFEELLRHQEQALSRDHPDVQLNIANLAVNYLDAGKFCEAIELLEEVYVTECSVPDKRWETAQLLDAYAEAKFESAFESLAIAYLSDSKQTLTEDSAELANVLVQIGNGYLRLGRFREAMDMYRRGYQVRKNSDATAWTTFNAAGLLGAAMLGAGKESGEPDRHQLFEEAEALLERAYEGLRNHEGSLPLSVRKRIPETLDYLIELNELTGDSQQVAHWRELRGS